MTVEPLEIILANIKRLEEMLSQELAPDRRAKIALLLAEVRTQLAVHPDKK